MDKSQLLLLSLIHILMAGIFSTHALLRLSSMASISPGSGSHELPSRSSMTVIKLARIEEPIAKGLALGTSAHAIGTAKAMELGEIEGAMSSLAIAVAGLLTVVGASVFAQFM